MSAENEHKKGGEKERVWVIVLCFK